MIYKKAVVLLRVLLLLLRSLGGGSAQSRCTVSIFGTWIRIQDYLGFPGWQMWLWFAMSRAIKWSVGGITSLLLSWHLDFTMGPMFLDDRSHLKCKLCNSHSQTIMCMWITQESSQICGLSFSGSAWDWRVCISSKFWVLCCHPANAQATHSLCNQCVQLKPYWAFTAHRWGFCV